MTPKISYIIASRNDNYCGDSLARLSNTLFHLSMYVGGEFIVVDWGSEVPISEKISILGFPAIECRGNIRFIHVPQDITKQYKTPFNEVVALNIAARRAVGTYVARLDQDIIIGQEYAKWCKELPDTGWAPAYFSQRRELAEDSIPSVANLKPENFPVWGNWPLTYDDFYKAAVGIILAPRSKWHLLRGYNEQLIYRNHMEHDLCRRFKQAIGLENLGLILNADFYHQWHSDVDTIGRPQNIQPTEEILHELAERIKVNDENWGMGQHKFEEVVI